MNPACSICMERITQNCHTNSTNCGHVFHNTCILQCFRNNPACPICRNPCTELYPLHLSFHNCAEESEATSKKVFTAAVKESTFSSPCINGLGQRTQGERSVTVSPSQRHQSKNSSFQAAGNGEDNHSVNLTQLPVFTDRSDATLRILSIQQSPNRKSRNISSESDDNIANNSVDSTQPPLFSRAIPWLWLRESLDISSETDDNKSS